MKVQDTLLTVAEAKALSGLLNAGWAEYEWGVGTGDKANGKRWLESARRGTDKIRVRAGRKPGEPVGLADPLYDPWRPTIQRARPLKLPKGVRKAARKQL